MIIEEKAQQYYNQALSNCGYGTDDLSTKDVLSAMIQFATEMCELQKKECAENIIKEAKEKYGTTVPDAWDTDSILNCQNVCEN